MCDVSCRVPERLRSALPSPKPIPAPAFALRKTMPMNPQDSIVDASSRFIQGRHGLLSLLPQEQDVVARCLRRYGEWAEQELELLAGLLLPGHHVLEFGGHYGAQTLPFAKLVGETGAVHVVEPERLAFQQVCANLAINGICNAHAHEQYLGSSVGAADADPRAARPGSVDALALPQLNLMKVNIPGALKELLAGAQDTLRQSRPYIHFLQGDLEDAAEEIEIVKALGYRCWSHVTYLFSGSNALGETRNLFPGRVQQSVLALPVEAAFDLPQLIEL